MGSFLLRRCVYQNLYFQWLKQTKQNISLRNLSLSYCNNYEVRTKNLDRNRAEDYDFKPDSEKMFKHAIKSVHPQQMIESVLEYNSISSVLKVQKEVYHLDKNVYVVGMGKAVLGMAKAVEDLLGDHLVTGIISIPKGMGESMQKTNNSEMILIPKTKVKVFECDKMDIDEHSHNASKAMFHLVESLTEKDLLIVLCSGGGSILSPSPPKSIALEELNTLNRILNRAGASNEERNIVRKNIEILKGGGMAKMAKPAKVVSLILSSIIGDPIALIAGGPTYPAEPTPSYCLEILRRLGVLQETPMSIRKHLEKLSNLEKQKQRQLYFQKQDQDSWKGVQNIVVGNNSIACEAAAKMARQLGYCPVIITTSLTGEARDVGKLYAKIAEFVMMCFDQRMSKELNILISKLEVELVRSGVKKTTINQIVKMVDGANNFNSDVCIIASGQTAVHVKGNGTGGKNHETALGAALQLKEDFRMESRNEVETRMCLMSGDTDGFDGTAPSAGAVVDLEFVDKVIESGLCIEESLSNSDSYTLFTQVNDGKNLLWTNHTGTNVMDLVILLVRKPIERKYKWEK